MGVWGRCEGAVRMCKHEWAELGMVAVGGCCEGVGGCPGARWCS